MKAVILAGGLGTRIAEESTVRPKPMVEIGGKPVLWHIMKLLGHQGLREFVMCLGYKGDLIKEYFLNYEAMTNDLEIQLGFQPGLFPEASPHRWVVFPRLDQRRALHSQPLGTRL